MGLGGAVDLLRVVQRCGYFRFGEVCPVVAFYQQCQSAALVDVPGPAERFVQQAEFFVKPAFSFQRRDRLGAGPL